ncbi:ABC transporter substrate-binding protein [Mesobacillus subterraneus]|uniref:ABC transporter substrate-binding protein n=1 Tax=Mesobacillus subterraneus TaxID=285983 RepID=UPI00203A4C85|nr:ABC transporter substrate-binding protein [Mesobacillus subterraneus]MCM3666788.1 ABC transporter substrate-binding protein [Mesobacillus subterraneus]MCM3685684.1 ABC transporter substrate-binding protein [Mesobacillus subterraneus]
MEEKKQMKKLLLIMMTVAMVLVGCGTEAQPEKKEGEKAAQEQTTGFPVTVKDALDEDIVIENQPEKIISLIPSNTEVVYALENGDAIVGVTDFDNYPEEAMSKEKIGGMEINIEKMISLKPDLVLAHESTADSTKAGLQQLKDAGIDVVVVNDAQSFDGVYESIEMIGKAIGEPQKAAELVGNMKNSFAELKKQAESIKPDQQKSVFVEVSPAPEIYTAGKNTFINEMLELIGAKNAAGDMEGWAKVDQEAIVERNPDVVVTTYGYYTENAVELVLGRQGWENVKAVKGKQVFDVHSDLVTRSGPRLAEGAEELAKAIYPDVFK